MFNSINVNDPQIWVAFSFLLFFIFFGSFVWKKLSKFLDDKINSIEEEITSASNLHQEAKDLLSEETKKFQGLDSEIKQIIEEGKTKAQNLYLENKDKIHNDIKKLEKSSEEKINYLEKQTIIEIQNNATKKAIKLTENFLIENLDKEAQSKMLNNSIKELENSLLTSNKFIQ
jgi:F-type H+-transporting ATPase subunit b